MSDAYEVPEPILNSPYAEPAEHWWLRDGEPPEKRIGRRPAGYWYAVPGANAVPESAAGERPGEFVELPLVNEIRKRIAGWRSAALAGGGGVSRTTCDLMNHWHNPDRPRKLFFAQLEAAETIIFLTEARADLLQGITVPPDEPGDSSLSAFRRYACKMATGGGKTTVMGLLAAWSILNKVADRSNGKFSDTVLVVCPNVTIRNRLAELDPARGPASLYRTRDLVPVHQMADLAKGKVVVTNWHVFEPQLIQTGGVSARVSKAGRNVDDPYWVRIGPKTTSARGKRYLSFDDYRRQRDLGQLDVLEEKADAEGNLVQVRIRSEKYVESDTALLNRVLGREVGGKQNILVFNDEAHHAYRIRQAEPDENEDEDDEDDMDDIVKEATVWVDGLDRIHKGRGINFCVDLSATPYYLGRVGQDTNRTFPWVVSDFGLIDAIESGLVKIPQLAVRDTSGQTVPGYFNIWRWILPQMTTKERGAKHSSPSADAVLKYAFVPIVMLAGLSEDEVRAWAADPEKKNRKPVFIIVCKNTKIAKVVHEWLAGIKTPAGIPAAGIAGFLNSDGVTNTIRVDTKVVHDTDSDAAKSDDSAWMRRQLDTVGHADWTRDPQGRAVYPEGFEDLAKKLGRPLHPPGRDVRCIVSVGMLTEGWDCTTVTHVIGLRPFMSQLLCEQVVGRGLRRASYEVGENGLMREEVAKVLGVPFAVIPFKANPGGTPPPVVPRHHVHALPQRADLEITFPRVDGYTQAIRNGVAVNWAKIAPLVMDPHAIPTDIQMKAMLPTNTGRPSLLGPGGVVDVSLNSYRHGRRVQELTFALAADIVGQYCGQPSCEAPPHVLFPQVARIVERYLRERVEPVAPSQLIDVFCSPYYGWVHERLLEEIHPDAEQGETPEVARYETGRGPGSTADVSFWTSKEVQPVIKSHLNYIVADTQSWEQKAAFELDRHEKVEAFVKNEQLGFGVSYLHNGQVREYIPDFLVRIRTGNGPPTMLLLEIKGFRDPLKDVKAQAAERWAAAVNAEGSHGRWCYRMARSAGEVAGIVLGVSG